jgi:hypothetical protein
MTGPQRTAKSNIQLRGPRNNSLFPQSKKFVVYVLATLMATATVTWIGLLLWGLLRLSQWLIYRL